ncbi:MAG: hypothetical protein V3T88_01645 [Nitrosomonadaceae bacterium]
MAIHRFICDPCKELVRDTTCRGIHKCPKCGGDMRVDCNVAIHGNYKHPVHSDALAISPTQRAEHEQLFPNIRLDNQCRPIFDNFTNHEAYLKKTGFGKERQRLKHLGKIRI